MVTPLVAKLLSRRLIKMCLVLKCWLCPNQYAFFTLNSPSSDGSQTNLSAAGMGGNGSWRILEASIVEEWLSNQCFVPSVINEVNNHFYEWMRYWLKGYKDWSKLSLVSNVDILSIANLPAKPYSGMHLQ